MSRLTWAARLWSEGGALGKRWTQRAWEQEDTAYQPFILIHSAQYVLVHTHKRDDSRSKHSQDKATMMALENNALFSLTWCDWHQGGYHEARQKSRPFASAKGRKAGRREAWWARKELYKQAWPGLTGKNPLTLILRIRLNTLDTNHICVLPSSFSSSCHSENVVGHRGHTCDLSEAGGS